MVLRGNGLPHQSAKLIHGARGLQGDGKIKNTPSLRPYTRHLRSICLCFITHMASSGALDADLRTENVLRDSWGTHLVTRMSRLGGQSTIRDFASTLQSEAPGSIRLEVARIGPATCTLMGKRGTWWHLTDTGL